MRLLTAAAVALTLALVLPAAASAGRLVGVCGNNLCTATEGGKVTPLTRDGTADKPYSSPGLSVDGKRMVYLKAGDPYLGGANPATATRLLEDAQAREITISQDGKSFSVRTFATRFTGSGLRLESAVFLGGAVGSARYSSFSTIYYAGWLASKPIASYDAQDGAPSRVCPFPVIASTEAPPCAGGLITAPVGTSFLSPVGSPDGKLVVAEVNPPDTEQAATIKLMVGPPTGALARPLTGQAGDSAPAFAPDGRRVAFTRGADTWTVPATGGRERRLAAGVTQATWGGTPGAPAAASARLKLKGRRLSLTASCRDVNGCRATRLTARRGRAKVAVLKVPTLVSGKRRTVSVRISGGTVRKIRAAGRAGLALKLSGKGFKTRAVRAR